MNILELAFSSAWGGLEMLVGDFSKSFRKKGHNVIAVIEPNQKLEEEFRKNEIEFKAIKPICKYLDMITANKIYRDLSTQKIDIIHTHMSKDLSTAILLKKKLKSARLIYTQHMDSRYNKKDLFHKWIHKNVDKVICVTNSMKKNNLAHTTLSNDKISVIYNGIDLSRFNKNIVFNKREFLRKKNIPQDRIIVGTIGRIDRLKKQELLIEVASELITKFENKVHFILIGEETDSITGRGYKDELLSKILDRNLDSYFSIFDFSAEVEKFFSILDIFVLTTPKETFGLVLLEAMAMGKPVIASNRGGPPEIIDDGSNGYLFEPTNTKELSEKISYLLANQEIRESMGQKSIELVINKFDINNVVNEYLNTFEKFL